MAKTLNDEATEPKAKRRAEPNPKAVVESSAINSIEFLLEEPASSSSEARRRKAVAQGENSVERGDTQDKSSFARIPDSVLERFVKIGNQFYFPDGKEAFAWEKGRLTTRSENAIVITSMVAIAREESPTGTVRVTGTDFFRKEAWFAAGLTGLKVEGYEPTELEQERLVRAIARRAAPGDTLPATDREKREGESSAPAKPAGDRAKAPAESEFLVGRLVDHGAAPYQHNPKEAMSYFVRIETARGERDVWGVDLERAFHESLSRPGLGDEVGIRTTGRESVTVPIVKQAPDGQEIHDELDTYRNRWIIERVEFLAERKVMAKVFRDVSITAEEGTRRHRGLEGSYWQLQMGQAVANEQSGSKLHREQFVQHLREHLARGIEYGYPLETAQLREREDRTVEPKTQDRDYHPTR